MIQINGQDGGGQVLRSALSLSMITGQAFRMVNIRGQRSKPGLMRQHLTCVRAAMEVCDGSASGAEMHSKELVFKPGKVKDGKFVFKIGTAGSTTLLFQTVLPALMFTDGESNFEIHGGTHNPMAPTADFIERAFLPQLREMGVEIEFGCIKRGFAPAGGGAICGKIFPVSELARISIMERGESLSRKVECLLANVKERVADKEMVKIQSLLDWETKCYETVDCNDVDGSGNVLFIEEVFENTVIHVISHGKKTKSAEQVATEAVKNYHTFVKSKAAVGVRLADQLLLPMALSGAGELKTVSLTNHIKTNIHLIEKFIDVDFEIDETESGGVVLRVERRKMSLN